MSFFVLALQSSLGEFCSDLKKKKPESGKIINNLYLCIASVYLCAIFLVVDVFLDVDVVRKLKQLPSHLCLGYVLYGMASFNI